MNYISILLTLYISIGSINISAQEYHKVDSIVDTYPKSFYNPDKLSQRICFDFQDPSLRARAIYAWIGKNIRYDVKAIYSRKKKKSYSYKSKNEKLKKEIEFESKTAYRTLRKRKAVCYGYSALYKKLCESCEIQCVLISGGDKIKYSQIGKKPNLNAHAWNSVKINDSWKFVDVTWAAGSVNTKEKKFVPGYSDAYFFPSAEKFFLNHFPKDTSWILTNKTRSDFIRLPLFYTDYLLYDINIVSPSEGTITIGEKDTLNFMALNLPLYSSVSYKYSTEKIFHEVKSLVYNNLFYDFTIINHSTRNGYLTLFIGGRPIVTYKIILI